MTGPAERFDRILGARRGPGNGLDSALRELALVERKLRAAEERLAEERRAHQRAADTAEVLNHDFMEMRIQLGHAQQDAGTAREQRDRARYIAVAAGAPDALPIFEEVHQGIWTPGRPYLGGEHVWHPRKPICYCAAAGGVLPGVSPGSSPVWERCPNRRSLCPKPVPLPRKADGHPVSTGLAFRQTAYWWDADGKRRHLARLTDEHFVAVLDWLEQNLQRIWTDEQLRRPVLVPCPPNAYGSDEDWLVDTPLMRALQSKNSGDGPRRYARGRE